MSIEDKARELASHYKNATGRDANVLKMSYLTGLNLREERQARCAAPLPYPKKIDDMRIVIDKDLQLGELLLDHQDTVTPPPPEDKGVKFTIEEVLLRLKGFENESQFMQVERCFRKLGDRVMHFSSGMKGLSVGKRECEPDDWGRYYQFLVALGLIEFTLTFTQGKGMVDGGPFIKGQVKTTEFGKLVRERLFK